MSSAIEFRHPTSDDEASFLRPDPGTEDGLYLVLFCDEKAPTVEKARELAPRADIPSDWEFVLLDPTDAPETARRFGVADTQGMAAIRDGSLLSIEYECSLNALKRLVETARRQSEALEQLG
jgi:hypothetical protein